MPSNNLRQGKGVDSTSNVFALLTGFFVGLFLLNAYLQTFAHGIVISYGNIYPYFDASIVSIIALILLLIFYLSDAVFRKKMRFMSNLPALIVGIILSLVVTFIFGLWLGI